MIQPLTRPYPWVKLTEINHADKLGETMGDRICDRLGITYPILQGPMAWASDSNLAAAVSNAGGLGSLGIGTAPPDVGRVEVRKTKALTDRPFGYNVYAFLPHVAAVCDMLVEERVAVAEIGAMPGDFDALPGHVAKLKAAGTVVIGKAATVAEAVAYERAGVDFVAIKGADGGGHIFGFTGTFSLLPQVVDAVSVPVINGGGVADGRGMAASLVMGAAAVEIGSRFLLAEECPVHQNYKNAILRAREGETVVTGVICGDAVRQLPNSLSERLLKAERECTVEEAIRAIQTMGTDSLRKAAVDGDIENGCVTVGQTLGLLNKTQTAKEIVEELVADCSALLRGAPYLL
jgi:enoyl-[acyl-carrier protein] reductase II